MKVSEFLELTHRQLPCTYVELGVIPIDKSEEAMLNWDIFGINITVFQKGDISKHTDRLYPYTTEIGVGYELSVSAPLKYTPQSINKYKSLTTHTYSSGETVYVLKSESNNITVKEFLTLGHNKLSFYLRDENKNYIDYTDTTCKYDVIGIETKVTRDTEWKDLDYDEKSKTYTIDFNVACVLTVRKPDIKIPIDLPITEGDYTLHVEKPTLDNTDSEYILSIRKNQ